MAIKSTLRGPVAVAGIAVLGGAIGLTLWRTRVADQAAQPESAGAAASQPVEQPSKAAVRAPTGPMLPAPPPAALPPQPELPTPGSDGAAPKTVVQVFTSEPRDPSWAPRTEGAIRDRLANLGAKLETECHQTQCKLVLEGGTAAVSKAIARIESANGLVGFASSIMLTAPEQRADGTLVLRAFATFDR